MNKFGGLIVAVLIAGWGASKFMGWGEYGMNEKMTGKAEQLKGRVEQSVGKATGSDETQARGEIDEAKGKAREKIAEAKGNARAAIEEVTAEANR